MSLSSASSAIFRRSYSNWDESSFSSLDLNGSPSSHRLHSLRNSRPSSASSSRGSLHETPNRLQTNSYKEPRKRRDSVVSPQQSNRMSFIDFGDDSSSSSKLFGSLKGRMQRKRSAPILGSSNRTNEPSTSYAILSRRPSTRFALGSIRDDDDDDTSWMTNSSPMPSLRDERKLTLVPDEIVDGIGYGIRQSRLSTVAESEVGEDVDYSKSAYRPPPLKTKDGMLLHTHLRSVAPYMRSYNKVDLQK